MLVSARSLCDALTLLGSALSSCLDLLSRGLRILNQLVLLSTEDDFHAFVAGVTDHFQSVEALTRSLEAAAAAMGLALEESIATPLAALLPAADATAATVSSAPKKSGLNRMTSMLTPKFGRGKRKAGGRAAGDSLEQQEGGRDGATAFAADPEERARDILVVLMNACSVFTALGTAVGAEGKGAVPAEPAAKHLGTVFSIWAQIVPKLEVGLEQLSLPALPPFGQLGAMLGEALDGMKATVYELRGEAIKELEGIMGSAADTLDGMVGDEALSSVCEALTS